jgi:hypothetical protein
MRHENSRHQMFGFEQKSLSVCLGILMQYLADLVALASRSLALNTLQALQTMNDSEAHQCSTFDLVKLRSLFD